MKNQFCTLIFVALVIFMPSTLWAIGGENYISTTDGKDFFVLSASGRSSTLYISSNDYVGVIRALKDLKSDIEKVTNNEPAIVYDETPSQNEAVIVGTIGKSAVIDQLIKNGKIDVGNITGKWENFLIQVVKEPLPGVDKALVIVGSDKRGTIYGIYDVSEKIGVSPWYWWADVPVEHKDALYVKPGIYTEGPSVKYRGIFLNDEAPDLTNWVREKYGTVTPGKNPPIPEGVANYNHEFYSRIFELLLRLKANYLWPAMWDNAFNEDDPENPRLANEYGIVMGTSHQEPMLRAQKEWDRRYLRTLGSWDYYKYPDTMNTFWRDGIRRNKNYESIITMGLRGANDSEIKGDVKDNIAMIEKIVKTQQNIIAEEMNPDINKVPQMWCLYKEIMDYYNQGMTVPGNITLLWADDNWGNIRRLPDPDERKRSGGAGIYYHFDYHGGPRSYQWINTNPLPKIWDQMELAKQYGADRIWIVNVGHFKGYELPMEYFLSLAWNTNQWNNTNLNEFTRLWAEKQFGPTYAGEIADILSKYSKYNGRRKPESLSPNTYSLTNYNEAEDVVSDFNKITAKAEAIYDKLAPEKRDAFYELVLFPAKASAVVNELYVTAGKNELYASQGRASANEMATRTRDLFRADTTMMAYYNQKLANGKWDHFMDQAHLGYRGWSPPRNNNLNAIRLNEIQVPDSALMGVALEGTKLSWPGSAEEASLPGFDLFSNRRHYLEIFNRGKVPFEYTLTTNVPWLTFSESGGTVNDKDKRIWVSVEESQLPEGTAEGVITISGAGKKIPVKVTAFNPAGANRENLHGFVESGGLISIDAEHFSKNTGTGSRKWILVEDYGLTSSGLRASAPANAPAAIPEKDSPSLEYPMYFFSDDSAEITLVTSPVLNFMPDRDIRLAVSFDNGEPQYVTVVPDKYQVPGRDWNQAVLDQARHLHATLRIPKAGYHTFKVWMVDPGVILEKIIVNTGGLKPSYLGPPESLSIR